MVQISGSSLWQLIYYSDWLTWSTLFSLFILSIMSWSILFYKLVTWRAKKKQLKNAIASLRNAKNLEEVVQIASELSNTLPGLFISKNLNILKSFLVTEKGTRAELSDRELDFLKDATNNIIDELMYQEESYLSFLSVTAAASPLLGLFGTVWGLIHAFIDISQRQTADISAVAPGIAEALVTTLAGLIVAIPSLIIYYQLKSKAASIEQLLVNMSDKLSILIQKHFIKSYGVNNAFEPKKTESWSGSRNNLDSPN